MFDTVIKLSLLKNSNKLLNVDYDMISNTNHLTLFLLILPMEKVLNKYSVD